MVGVPPDEPAVVPPDSDVPPVDVLDWPAIEFCNVTVHGWLFTFTQIDFDGRTPDERTRK
jgi:hypothetical protein